MDFSLLKGIVDPSKKILFTTQLSKILENEDENSCLKALNSIYKFDKKYSPQLCPDIRLFLEKILIEKYKFIFDTTQSTNSIILCCKFIIQKRNLFSEEDILKVCDKLVFMLKSENNFDNQKFDIAQTLKNIRIDELYQNIGKNFVESQKNNINDLYKGSQNVHNIKISEITKNAILILEKDKTPLINNNDDETITQNCLHCIEEFKNEYLSLEEKHLESIKSSLNRIETDTTVFYPTNIMLSEVFQKVYNRIKSSVHKEDLFKRLKEELVEMNDTCSSGHVTRLINVLSGFKDVEPKVKVNFSKEITYYIRRIVEDLIKKEREDVIDILLESVYKDKKEYSYFMDKNKQILKESVNKEFLQLVIKEELDIVFESCFDIVKRL